LEKAIQLIEQGQIDEAMAILDELSITESDEIKFTISTVFFEFGFYEKAETILTDLLGKYPNDGQVIIQLVDIYIELKRDDEAIRLLNEIEEKDEFYLHALLQLADLYQSQGLFEVAEEKLLTAKKIAPDEL